MRTVPIRAAEPIPASVLARVGDAFAQCQALADLMRWCRSQTPYVQVAEIVTQDEYTHDVVLPFWPVFLSFDTTWLGPPDLERAARAAQIHDHIRGLPGGYDAGIEEGGRNLSRGQRQRIALARALVTKPGVLILDEATASLDVASERAVKTAIQSLRGQVTVVVIAHQGELLADVDHVIVLGRGRVLQTGVPDRPTMSTDLLATFTHQRNEVLAEL